MLLLHCGEKDIQGLRENYLQKQISNRMMGTEGYRGIK
jgi:hypothetical protein